MAEFGVGVPGDVFLDFVPVALIIDLFPSNMHRIGTRHMQWA